MVCQGISYAIQNSNRLTWGILNPKKKIFILFVIKQNSSNRKSANKPTVSGHLLIQTSLFNLPRANTFPKETRFHVVSKRNLLNVLISMSILVQVEIAMFKLLSKSGRNLLFLLLGKFTIFPLHSFWSVEKRGIGHDFPTRKRDKYQIFAYY